MIRNLVCTLCLITVVSVAGCSSTESTPADSTPVELTLEQQFAELESNFAATNKKLRDELEKITPYTSRTEQKRGKQINAEFSGLIKQSTELAATIAEKSDDPDLSAKAYTWIVRLNGKSEHANQALDIIKEKYLGSAFIGDALAQSSDRQLLDSVAKNSPHAGVKAVATTFIALNMRDGDEKETVLTSVEQEFADLKYRDRTLSDLIRQPLNVLRHLRVGKPAMDIKFPDTDGEEFKLSDYRGKIVMLDFWANT